MSARYLVPVMVLLLFPPLTLPSSAQQPGLSEDTAAVAVVAIQEVSGFYDDNRHHSLWLDRLTKSSETEVAPLGGDLQELIAASLDLPLRMPPGSLCDLPEDDAIYTANVRSLTEREATVSATSVSRFGSTMHTFRLERTGEGWRVAETTGRLTTFAECDRP